MGKPNYYAIIPAKVRYDDDLPFGARLLYGEITALANTHGACFASDKYFMDLYKSSKRTIQNWLNLLENKEYIKREVVRNEENKIVKRLIYINDTLVQPNALPYGNTLHYPSATSCTYNNTSINNTSNNSGATEVDDELKVHKEVIGYINELSGREFKHDAGSNIKLVNGRLNDNHSPDIIKSVMRYKWNEWKDTQMEKYFRPSTLLRKSNFDKYLEEYKFHEDHNKEEKEFDSMFGDVL